MGYDRLVDGNCTKQITASCHAIEVKMSYQFEVGGFHLMMDIDI